jgi:hypothetical protein
MCKRSREAKVQYNIVFEEHEHNDSVVGTVEVPEYITTWGNEESSPKETK